MAQRASVLFKTGWISLALIGVAILVFGLVATAVPTSSDPPYLRAIGVASTGMGIFGLLITTRLPTDAVNDGLGSPYGITQSSGQRTS
jgi:hypothetical protein